MTPRWTPLAVVLGLFGLMGLVSGCAFVPTSGSIEQGPVVDSGASTQFIRVIAAPPSAGAQPSEVVTGFLEANASLEGEHGIARQYLTRVAAARWAPEQRTTVYSLGSLQVTGAGGEVRASMDVTGELLADGTLRTVEPAAPRRIDLHLTQVRQGGNAPPEWRITDPPHELLVSDADLRRAYREHQVYFVSARTGTLVPDGRLLPVVGSALPTALAEEVLAGPSRWLAPGVVASTPRGTKLALGAVTLPHDPARHRYRRRRIALARLADDVRPGHVPGGQGRVVHQPFGSNDENPLGRHQPLQTLDRQRQQRAAAEKRNELLGPGFGAQRPETLPAASGQNHDISALHPEILSVIKKTRFSNDF